MKSNSVLKAIALLLGVVLLASAYGWWECRNTKRVLLVGIYVDGMKDARELSDAGGTFEYLLKENASDNLIVAYAYTYSVRSEHLEDALGILYAVTEDGKFNRAFSAVSNVHLFFQILSFSNSTERRTLIEGNLKTLKELDGLFKEITAYQYPEDLPEGLVEKLLNVSSELRWSSLTPQS